MQDLIWKQLSPVLYDIVTFEQDVHGQAIYPLDIDSDTLRFWVKTEDAEPRWFNRNCPQQPIAREQCCFPEQRLSGCLDVIRHIIPLFPVESIFWPTGFPEPRIGPFGFITTRGKRCAAVYFDFIRPEVD